MPMIAKGPSLPTPASSAPPITPSKNTARMLQEGKNLEGPRWFAFGSADLPTHVMPFTIEVAGEKVELRVRNRQLELSTKLDTLAGRAQPSRDFRPATADEARALADMVVKNFDGSYDHAYEGALNPETASVLLRAAHRRSQSPIGADMARLDVQSGPEVLRHGWVKDADLSWEEKVEVTLTLTTLDGPVRLWTDRLTREVRIDESFGARPGYAPDTVAFRTPTEIEKRALLTALTNRAPHVPYDIWRFQIQQVADIFARALADEGVTPLPAPPPAGKAQALPGERPAFDVDRMERPDERRSSFVASALLGFVNRR